jgi:hypothetical protein
VQRSQPTAVPRGKTVAGPLLDCQACWKSVCCSLVCQARAVRQRTHALNATCPLHVRASQVKAYRDQLSTDFTEALLAAEDSRSPDVRARTFKKARVLNTCSVRLKVPSELGASRVVPSYAALRARSSARPSDSDMGADVV